MTPTRPAIHPLDPIHAEVPGARPHLIQVLTRRHGAPGPVAEETPLDAERDRRIRDAQTLDRFAAIAHRLLGGSLAPSRHLMEGELPSLAEMLTIERCGYPRIHGLNDGLGPDMASPCRVTGMHVSHLSRALAQIGA